MPKIDRPCYKPQQHTACLPVHAYETTFSPFSQMWQQKVTLCQALSLTLQTNASVDRCWCILWIGCSTCCWARGGRVRDADASCTCQTSITLLRVCTSIQRRQYITLANAAQFPPRTTPTHLPIQPPTWLAISESALLWLEDNSDAEGEPVHSVRAAHLPVCIKSSTVWVVCVCAHTRCVWIRARLSAWWLLQDWAELQPIFPGDRDVGRHLPRHLWSSPQPNSTSGLWTPLIFFLYIWCYQRRMTKCSSQKLQGDNWVDVAR